MNTQLFKYAIEIEKTGSVTKAAQNLFMAQPNLSKSMKELEEQLGFEIFARTPGGMLPTENGSKFLTRAKNILEQIRSLKEMGRNGCVEAQKYHISIPRGSYIVNGFVEMVGELNLEQDMEIIIHETNSMNIINNVVYENNNLGIIRYQSNYENYFMDYIKNKNLSYELVWEFEYVVAMSKNHPLAGMEEIQVEDLHEYIELSHADLMIPYMNKSGMDKKEKNIRTGKHIYVYDRGCQYDLLTKLPSAYMLVSPVPQNYRERYDLVQRKCKIPNNYQKDVLIYREDYTFSELDNKFKKKLIASRDEVAAEICI